MMDKRDLEQGIDGIEILKIANGEVVPEGAMPVEAIFNLVVSKLNGAENECLQKWLSSITDEQREGFRLLVAYMAQYLSIKARYDFERILTSCGDVIRKLLGDFPGSSVLTRVAISYGLIKEQKDSSGLGQIALSGGVSPRRCKLTLHGFRVVSEREKYPFDSTFNCIVGDDFELKVRTPGGSNLIGLGYGDFIKAGKNGGVETQHNAWIVFSGNTKKSPMQEILFPSKFKVKLCNGKEMEIDGNSAWEIIFEDL